MSRNRSPPCNFREVAMLRKKSGQSERLDLSRIPIREPNESDEAALFARSRGT
jgi:hypothetical protein